MAFLTNISTSSRICTTTLTVELELQAVTLMLMTHSHDYGSVLIPDGCGLSYEASHD